MVLVVGDSCQCCLRMRNLRSEEVPSRGHEGGTFHQVRGLRFLNLSEPLCLRPLYSY